MLSIGRETQYQIRDASGTIVWQGACAVGVDHRVKNTDSGAIGVETAMIADGPNTVVGTGLNPVTSDPLNFVVAGKAVVNAASVGFLGVSLEPIPVGGFGFVGGPGTICAVRVTAAALAVGALVSGSGTAALCAAMGTGSATTNLALGTCVKARATLGSGDYCGVLVGVGN